MQKNINTVDVLSMCFNYLKVISFISSNSPILSHIISVNETLKTKTCFDDIEKK